ncbi:MAG: protein translocase subunit SecF [Spirochaetia bacterium]
MKKIPFLKLSLLAMILSILGLAALWGTTFKRGGFNVGVDFKPGLSMSVLFAEGGPTATQVRQTLESVVGIQVQNAENQQMIVRIADTGDADFQQNTERNITELLVTEYPGASIISSQFVGASYSDSLIRNSILLVFGALLVIVFYLWVRFQLSYSISAVLSTLHDVLFVIGFIGAMQLEVNAATVAAVLTIIGYSLNDTIVTFDRIRENSFIEKRMSFNDLIDLSITQTLSRTIITSITTLLSIVAIVFLATGSVKLFAIELVFGIVIGTYSSIFVAGASLSVFLNHHSKKSERLNSTSKKALKA